MTVVEGAGAGSGSGQTFDLSLKLKQRLQEMNVQKGRTQAKINASNEQLQRMFKQIPKKPRDSAEQMDAKLIDLEFNRTKSSLVLSDEKAILRQLDAVKRSKVQLEEYYVHEGNIQKKKAELSNLRDSLRSTTAAIAELESALSKVELAKRLGCTPVDLQSVAVDCPGDRLGSVIGKGGANLKLIEERTGVHVDVDKVGLKIHLHGNDSSLDAAVREVEDITLAIEEEVAVPPSLVSYLLSSRRLGLLDKLQEKHHGVYLDMEKDSTTLKIRGRPERVAAAKGDILSISVKTETRQLSPRESGLIVGKGGATVTKLVESHGVVVNIPKKGGEVSTLEVIGPASGVDAAMAEIETILHENEDVEESVLVQPMQRTKLLTNAGAGIKGIQADINGEVLPGSNVFLSFEKFDDPKGGLNGPSKLVIRTTRSNMGRAKEIVQSRIDVFEADLIIMSVSPEIIPAIIGKGGATIKALRKEGAGGEIDVDKVSGVVKIQSDDKETREKMKEAVDEIIRSNQVRKVEIQKSLIGYLLGESGKDVRKQVADIGASLNIDGDDKFVILRGTDEQITEAANLVNNFIEIHYTEEYEVPAEDQVLLFQGGEQSLVKRLERDYDVSANIRKATNMLIIRGKKDNVQSAVADVNRIFVGGDGYAVSKGSIPDGVVGIVIGKGGSNVAKMESENEGVTVQVNKETNNFIIRGPAEKVAQCRASLISTISTARVIESVLISSEQHESLDKSDATKKIASDTSTQITLSEKSVRIRGITSDVRDAKNLVNEVLTGKYVTSIELDAVQVPKVSAAVIDPAHFDRIRSATDTEVSLDTLASAICISGKRSNVKKAKTFVLGFLDFLLPAEFSRVKVAKPLLKSMGDAAELAKIAADSGASAALDRDLSSILVRSSDPENVSKAVGLLQARMKECEKLNHVERFDRSDAWLLAKIIGKGGKTIQALQKDSGCNIDVSKEDLTVAICGDTEENVDKVKVAVDKIIDQERKQCVFIDIPESAMAAFIGKAGAHIKQLAEDHGVTIERLRKNPTRVQIQGDEVSVASAKAAVDEWLKNWEAQHVGVTVDVKEYIIPAILGKQGSVVNAIQKDLGVRIDIDRRAFKLTIRGGNEGTRGDALKKIEAIICEQEALAAEKEEARENKAAEDAAARLESLAAARNQAGSGDAPKERKMQPEPEEDKKDRTNEFASVPVGMTVVGGQRPTVSKKSKNVRRKENTAPKNVRRKENTAPKKTSSGSQNGLNLLDMLLSNSADPPVKVASAADDLPPSSQALTDENWDSSTVSSAAISSTTEQEDETVAGPYYKSTASGFTVRI